jgi:hypothetical protein
MGGKGSISYCTVPCTPNRTANPTRNGNAASVKTVSETNNGSSSTHPVSKDKGVETVDSVKNVVFEILYEIEFENAPT